MAGIVAVALAGSRALGSDDAASDWDLGVYYRGSLDLGALERYGVVCPPGSWGRLMNGGAWLRHGDVNIDVILRDVDTVEQWTRAAEHGDFEVDALLGYVAGAPTYVLAAELASCRWLVGALPVPEFPLQLATTAPARWRICRSFSLDYARRYAIRSNRAMAMGQANKAALEEAHAIMCERRRWVCNEKRLLEAAGLASVQMLFAHIPEDPDGLLEWVNRIGRSVGDGPADAAPWRRIGPKS
jgi:hypothetical protein